MYDTDLPNEKKSYIYCGNPKRFWLGVGLSTVVVALVVTISLVVGGRGGGDSRGIGPMEASIPAYLPPADLRCQNLPGLEEEEATDINPIYSCACYGFMFPISDDVYNMRVLMENAFGSAEDENDFDCSNPRAQAHWWTAQFAAIKPPVAPQELEQNYFLALLYLETGGLDWRSSGGWMELPEDEEDTAYCRWFGIECSKNEGEERVIQSIVLAENDVVGAIPTEVGFMVGLNQLVLHDGGLQGEIPFQIFESLGENLQVLDLGGNNLHGDLEGIAFLSNLQYLDVTDNVLTGTLPEFPETMIGLYLENNPLEGTLPDHLGNLVNLETLTLSYSLLEGSIPEALGNLLGLKELNLHHMMLTGSIPSELYGLTSLERVRMDSNHLTGRLAQEVGQWEALEFLDLSNNTFVGQLPSTMGNLRQLQVLTLHTNAFYGTIPFELGQLESLQEVILGLTAISGQVPNEICQLKQDHQLSFLSTDCTTAECSCCDNVGDGEGNCLEGRLQELQDTAAIEQAEEEDIGERTDDNNGDIDDYVPTGVELEMEAAMHADDEPEDIIYDNTDPGDDYDPTGVDLEMEEAMHANDEPADDPFNEEAMGNDPQFDSTAEIDPDPTAGDVTDDASNSQANIIEDDLENMQNAEDGSPVVDNIDGADNWEDLEGFADELEATAEQYDEGQPQEDGSNEFEDGYRRTLRASA